MKKFNHIVLIFIIPILIFGVSIEILLRQIPNDYKTKAHFLNTNASKVETLILGSSHTMYGVNPKYIDNSAYNLSHVSQTIDIDFELLKHYKSKMPRLRNLVLRLSYTTLFEKLIESPENWRLKDYTIYYQLPVENKAIHHSELLSLKLKTNLERVYNYYVLGISEQKCDYLGWGEDANSKFSKDLEKSGLFTAKKHTIDDKIFYKENIKTLNDIIKFCKTNNIHVTLVTLPAYRSYIISLEEKQLNATLSAGKLMDSLYDNCQYYDYLDHSEFVETDFFDADHLNEKGAKKVSLQLKTLLKH